MGKKKKRVSFFLLTSLPHRFYIGKISTVGSIFNGAVNIHHHLTHPLTNQFVLINSSFSKNSWSVMTTVSSTASSQKAS